MPFRSVSSVIGLQTTTTCPAPAGIVSGDLLVAIACTDGFNAAASTGWDAPNLVVQNITFDNQNLQLLTKTATGAEPGSYVFTNVSVGCIAILCFSGYTGGAVVEGTPGVDNTGNTTPISAAANGITVPAGSYDLLYVGGLDQNTDEAWAFSPPAGMTSRVVANEAGEYSAFAAATIDGAAAGATGTKTGTFSGGAGQAGWAAVLISFPATGGGPPPAGILRQMMQYQG
jgi:hypothetical protein